MPAAAQPAAAQQWAQPGLVGAPSARTLGPYYGDLEEPGELDRAVRLVSSKREIVLIHGDRNRLRMLVNLVANLNEHDIYHVLLLGFSASICDHLRKREVIGCAHSSFMWRVSNASRSGGGGEGAGGEGEGGGLAHGGLASDAELVAGRERWQLAPKYVAWIQKFHYMRKLLERKLRVLALDSDVVVTASPYPSLHGPFAGYPMVTAFDTKGGFANINVGILYLSNATVGGPVHSLFLEFERRVGLALALTPPTRPGKLVQQTVRFFWDQNLFNKVLLSAMMGRPLYMHDDSDTPWTSAHKQFLWKAARPEQWNPPERELAAPPGLRVAAPWYPRTAAFRWRALPPAAGSAASAERVLLSPPWLISADNSLGHRYKHWMYGARPAPCLLLHFVCVAAGEQSRILPMKLFGYWYDEAVRREVANLELPGPQLLTLGRRPGAARERASTAGAEGGAEGVAEGGAAGARRLGAEPTAPAARAARGRLLALADGTLGSPLSPRPWAELNALYALLGGLSVLSGRSPVLIALNCTGVQGGFLSPGALPSRCFWHVHTPGGGVACVFRLGNCGEHVSVASPAELEAALARGQPPPTVELDLAKLARAAPNNGTEARGSGRPLRRLLHGARSEEVVLLRLRLPPPHAAQAAHGQPLDPSTLRLLSARDAAKRAHPRLGAAMRRFENRCPELTDRSKQRRRECTNVC